MNLLELNHVEKSFENLSVLKDISISIGEGEIVSIIGPSGSGKSTLLRCATMLEKMDGGEIVYLGKKAAWTDKDGRVVYADKKEMKEIRSQYGLVFQNFNLFPHYSVLKNITDAPIHVQKRDKETVYKEARELLKKMGLSDKEDYYPCQLSGGQCQRVAIARALALNPFPGRFKYRHGDRHPRDGVCERYLPPRDLHGRRSDRGRRNAGEGILL